MSGNYTPADRELNCALLNQLQSICNALNLLSGPTGPIGLTGPIGPTGPVGPVTLADLDLKVTGPASSTDNAVARFDGATGKLVQNSSVIIDDNGGITSDTSVAGEKRVFVLNSGVANTSHTALVLGETLIGSKLGALSYYNASYPSAGLITANTLVMRAMGSGGLTIFNDSGNLTLATGSTARITIANAGAITTALVTSQANAVGEVPLTLKGFASQTANLTEWQNSSATVLASISKDGYLGIGVAAGTFPLSVQLDTVSDSVLGRFKNINTGAGGAVVEIDRGTDASNIRASSLRLSQNGTLVWAIGNLRRGGSDHANQFVISTTADYASTGGEFILTTGGNLNVGGGFAGRDSARLAAIGSAPASRVVVIRGAASQTANLTEWQNSAGTVLTSVLPDGIILTPGTVAFANAGIRAGGIAVGRGAGSVAGEQIVLWNNGTNQMSLAGAQGFNLANTVMLRFSSTTSSNGTIDAAIFRNAAGILEINNGTAGTFRDLRLRTLLPAAGTATTAPIRLTAGTNLTTPENGAFEYDGTTLFFTTGGVRRTVDLI